MGKSLTDMSDEVYRYNLEKGWEPDPDRTFGDECALLHSEVSEALEAYRTWRFEDMTNTLYNNPIADLPKPEGVGSEFADILVRLLHYARTHDIDLEFEFDRKMDYNRLRQYRHGGKLL